MKPRFRLLLALLWMLGLAAGTDQAAHAAQYTALGDSLTQGYNADPGIGQSAKHPHGFAPTLRRLLELNTGTAYTFDNRGVYGATSATVRSGQLANLSPAPDLVTITVGANDATAAAQNFALTEATYRGTGAGTFYDNLNAILSTLRTGAPGRRIVLANVPDLKRLPAIAALGAGAQARVDVFVRATNDIIVERATAYGATVVDLYNDPNATAAANVSSPPETGGDGFHPNRRGHDLLAARFVAGVNLSTVIDFQSLEHNDSAIASASMPYTEDGFVVSTPYPSTFGTQEERYPGSTALFEGSGTELVTLSRSGNAPFSLSAIDIAELNGPNAVTVTFTGTRADNSTVTQSFTTDGVFTTNNTTDNEAQTFSFPATFSNLIQVEWRQIFPYHQFDNIVVRDTVAAPFAPAEADLSVAVSAPPTARQGSTLSYTVTVTNGGASVEQGASLSFPLPSNTTFSSLSAPAGWAASVPAVGAGGTVSATSNAFGTGTATFTLVLNVSGSATRGSTLDAAATIDGLTPDPDYADRTSPVSTQVLEAQSLIVTTLSDSSTDTDGETSLREAIAFANTDGVNSDITFAASTFAAARKTITLNGTQLPAFSGNGTLNITAPAAGVEISGNDASRVFTVFGTATLTGLTIRNGDAGRGGGAVGGGVYNNGALTLERCTFLANRAQNGAAVFSGNDLNGRTLTLRNCTLSGNTALEYGGGLYNFVGLTVIENCTISGNTGSAGQGGVTSQDVNARTEVRSSIIAGNTGSDVGLAGSTPSNTFQSNGYNLIGSSSANAASAFNQTGDVTGNTSPGLEPLDDNVGPAQTRALAPGSVAVDAGDPALMAGTDQRGLPRVKRGRADIGAFEVQNERPSNAPIAKSTDEDQVLAFAQADFTAAFSDPDAGDVLSRIRITSLPTTGTLKLGAANVALNQEIAASSLGTLSYVPVDNASGSVSFGYQAADAYGFAAAASTVTITIAAANDVPALDNIESSALPLVYTEGDAATSITGTLTVADADAELTGATVSITDGFVSGEDFLIFNAQNGISGSYVVATGVLTLSGAATPAQYEAALRSVKYFNASGDNPRAGDRTVSFQVNDGVASSNIAARTVRVVAVNDGPRLFVPGAQSTDEDIALNFSGAGSSPNGILVTDSDTVTLSVTLSVSHGTLTLSGRTRLSFTTGDGTADAAMSLSGPQRDINAALEDLVYTPAPNFNGNDTLTLTASDGTAPTATDTIAITVNAAADAPTSGNGSRSVNEDSSLPFSATFFDNTFSDPDGDTLTSIRIDSVPAQGALRSGPRAQVTPGTILQRAQLGDLVYVPNPDFNGADAFTYSAFDGVAYSNSAAVTITVRAVNDAPEAQDQSLAATTRAVLPITLTATDIDSPASSLTFTLLAQPQNGTLSGSGANLRYTARPGFSGSDSFTFRASDGSLSSNTATITLRVSDTNRAPVAVADSASTAFNTPVAVQVLGNDSDPDADTLFVTAVNTGGTRGTVSISTDKRSVIFTPERGFSSSTSFGYTISDGVATASAPVTIQVQAAPEAPTPVPPTPGNRAPVAVADAYTTRGPLQVLASNGVLQNDSDADRQTLTASLKTVPRHGDLRFNRDGSFVYTPSVVYSGSDSFTYAAFDGTAESTPVTVTIQVQAPRDVTPPQVRLAGEAVWTLRQLIPARGSVSDVYALRGKGIVFSSGLKSVALQLQRGDGQYFNGRAFQRAPFNLRARLVNRSFFALLDALPTSFPQGRYLWTAIATDNAGLIGRAQQTMLVDVTPPRLVITSPAAGNSAAQVSRLTEVVVGASADAVRVDVTLRRGDGLYFNGRTFQAARILLRAPQIPSLVPSVFRLPLSLPTTPARYSIEARATDAAGNVGVVQRAVEIVSTRTN